MNDFTEIVTTEQQLRQILGEPGERVQRRVQCRLDAHSRTFIERSPFVLLATVDRQGRMDVSPKGDPPGFVRVLDETTLAIRERPGNKRADGFLNILDNPRGG